jgi:hypothetical protein
MYNAIWSEIKRAITKSHDHVEGIRLLLISDHNCTKRSSITTLLYPFWNHTIKTIKIKNFQKASNNFFVLNNGILCLSFSAS